MKVNRIFIAALFLFLLFVIIVEIKIPDKFSWAPTFSHTSNQPFGCMAMDSIIAASFDKPYKVSGITFPQLARDSLSQASILLVDDNFDADKQQCEAIEKLLDHGNDVMIVLGYSYGELDSLLAKRGVTMNSGSLSSFSYYAKESISQYGYLQKNDVEVVWTGATFPHRQSTYYMNDDISGGMVSDADLTRMVYNSETGESEEVKIETYKDYNNYDLVLVKGSRREKTYSCAVMSKRESQKGSLYLVACPLWFTNYGFLHEPTRTLALRLLSQLGANEIIRLDPSMNSGREYDASSSPLRYFLSKPPLRWGIYLTMLGILLSVFFTARRRQRVIPVVKPAVNMALELVEHMGLYYHSRHDNADLVSKRYELFKAELRRTLLIDVADNRDDAFATLERVTGISKDELRRDFDYIERVVEINENGQNVNDEVMRYCIDTMNYIEKMI